MNGKERVVAALHHQEPDRVPIWELGFHNAVARRLMGRDVLHAVGGGRTTRAVLLANAAGQEARRAIIRRIVDDTLTFTAHMGYDMVRLRPTDFLTPVAFGSGNWSPNALLEVAINEVAPGVWRVIHPASGLWSEHRYNDDAETLADADDAIKQGGIDAFRHYVEVLETQPIDLTSPPLLDALDGIRQAVTHPAARDIFVLGWGDVCYPGATAHVAVFLEAMALAPDLVERYMELTTEGIVALVAAQANLGIDGVTGGNDWAFKTGPMFSVRHLRRFIAPYLKRIVDEAHKHGLPYIKHGDGDLRTHLPVLVDEVGIDGLHAIEPNANMDIVDLKHRYGDRLALLGNLDCDLLVRGTPNQIDAEVARLMREVAPGGGYVFSTSNSVLSDVPLENVKAMDAAARRYGVYTGTRTAL
jgi:hypothetical protein